MVRGQSTKATLGELESPWKTRNARVLLVSDDDEKFVGCLFL